jgi:hypothetical protein
MGRIVGKTLRDVENAPKKKNHCFGDNKGDPKEHHGY